MTHNAAKIQGKFYPLQTNEWLRACTRRLKAQKNRSEFSINSTNKEVR